MCQEDSKGIFLTELEHEIWWESHWERLNRTLYTSSAYCVWLVRILILALVTYKVGLNQGDSVGRAFLLAIASYHQ